MTALRGHHRAEAAPLLRQEGQRREVLRAGAPRRGGAGRDQGGHGLRVRPASASSTDGPHPASASPAPPAPTPAAWPTSWARRSASAATSRRCAAPGSARFQVERRATLPRPGASRPQAGEPARARPGSPSTRSRCPSARSPPTPQQEQPDQPRPDRAGARARGRGGRLGQAGQPAARVHRRRHGRRADRQRRAWASSSPGSCSVSRLGYGRLRATTIDRARSM